MKKLVVAMSEGMATIYGESFDRDVGMGNPLKVERGQNALCTQGGLQYAPPIR